MANEFTQEFEGQDIQKEGPVARNIEKHTAGIPSDAYLWAAIGSMGASLALKLCGRKHDALFVGQWAAPFLLFGIYNKIVKVAGHDRENKGEETSEDWAS